MKPWTVVRSVGYRSTMARFLAPFALLCLASCSTPEVVLRNPSTGQVARCGGNVTGSLAGGMIGYAIQENNDSKCVASYIEQGFVRVK